MAAADLVTGTGVTLLMSRINDQLVVVCLLYDVSEANAIRLIGWSGRRRRRRRRW